MDFCDLDTPWGHVNRARAVLDFASMALSWSTLQKTQIDMTNDARDGLMWILCACSETLKKAEEEAATDIKIPSGNGQYAHCNDVQYL